MYAFSPLFATSTTMPSMLYLGAGWDFELVAYFGVYDEFVLVDAMPAVKHYVKGQAGYPLQEGFFETIDEYAAECGLEKVSQEGRHIIYSDGNIRVHYFFSTDMSKPIEDDELRAMMLAADTVFMRGFLYMPLAAITYAREIYFHTDTVLEERDLDYWERQGFRVKFISFEPLFSPGEPCLHYQSDASDSEPDTA